MNGSFQFQIRFSGIVVRFILPAPIVLPDFLAALRCEDTAAPTDTYTLRLLTEPLRPATDEVWVEGEAHIYQTDKGWLHIYPALSDEDGCQVACLLCPEGNHTLYYPASRWAYFSENWRCAHLLSGERLLQRHNALLLHSSVVHCRGKAILFSGPSRAGKSTQAQLWADHAGATIINGDRTVIMKKEDGFYGGGSIWSGTSGIYRPEQAPIAGIFLVEKAPFERLERLGSDAFAPLFTQTTLNSWDPDFMARICDLYADLLSQIPVYRLYCRPGREAVELVYQTLFGKELPL